MTYIPENYEMRILTRSPVILLGYYYKVMTAYNERLETGLAGSKSWEDLDLDESYIDLKTSLSKLEEIGSVVNAATGKEADPLATLWHWAARCNKTWPISQFLKDPIACQALMALDSQGNTALEVALACGSTAAAEMLQAHITKNNLLAQKPAQSSAATSAALSSAKSPTSSPAEEKAQAMLEAQRIQIEQDRAAAEKAQREKLLLSQVEQWNKEKIAINEQIILLQKKPQLNAAKIAELQAQAEILRQQVNQQDLKISVLYEEYQEQQEVLAEKEKILQNPVLSAFYANLQQHLNNAYHAASAIKSGKVDLKKKVVEEAVDLLAGNIPIPGANLVAKLINTCINKGRVHHIIRIAQLASSILAMEKISETVARRYTLHYSEIISKLHIKSTSEKISSAKSSAKAGNYTMAFFEYRNKSAMEIAEDAAEVLLNAVISGEIKTDPNIPFVDVERVTEQLLEYLINKNVFLLPTQQSSTDPDAPSISHQQHIKETGTRLKTHDGEIILLRETLQQVLAVHETSERERAQEKKEMAEMKKQMALLIAQNSSADFAPAPRP